MNLLSTKIPAGGIGFVGVHLLHKKEKVAKEILTYFIDHYKNLGASMALLYPFRPDFYKKMGFGFGTSMNQYKVKPSNLPKGNSKANISFAKEDEANYIAYLACINNPSKEFQYSGYQLALTYLMNNLYNVRKESYEILRKKYSEGLKRDLNYNYSYWKKKEGTVEKVWSNLNDKYLRSNNQANGVESYGLVTRLLLAEYKTREK